jgi:hypothetical protein
MWANRCTIYAVGMANQSSPDRAPRGDPESPGQNLWAGEASSKYLLLLGSVIEELRNVLRPLVRCRLVDGSQGESLPVARENAVLDHLAAAFVTEFEGLLQSKTAVPIDPLEPLRLDLEWTRRMASEALKRTLARWQEFG